jgi:formate/nitrite transporter FocA (FNT family)/nucleotide-binding universal stress UspA family protein
VDRFDVSSNDDEPAEAHGDEPMAPSTGSVVRDRFSSDEVFQRIVADADHEITSGARELFFSGVAGGLAISVTFLLYASMSAQTDSPFLAAVLYPLGFLYIIIGGYQLYTENTVPPVALVLERLASVPALLRHWLIVFSGNFAGAVFGALVLAYTGVFEPAAAVEALAISQKGVDTAWWDLFVKGAFAGLIVAGVVWVDFASTDTVSRVVMVYLAFLAIPMGNLFHSVVSVTETVYLVAEGDLALLPGMAEFVLPVFLGNTIGGVVFVTIVNYYQTSDRRLEIDRFEGVRRLTLPEFVLGRVAGRSYVPLFDSVEDVDLSVEDDAYHVLVPISNPRLETELAELACTLASAHENATVQTVHVVQTPERMDLDRDSGQHRRIVRESDRLMEGVRETIRCHDVDYHHSTIVSNRSFEDVFDAAAQADPDLVVMGWGEGQHWDAARAESPFDQLVGELPCDFLVVDPRNLDTSRVLLPTKGGPDSTLAASVARDLRTAVGAEVTLLQVASEGESESDAEASLRNWAADHDLADAELRVDSGDVEDAIVRATDDCSFVILGATKRGLLRRLARGTFHRNVAERVDCSVAMAERPVDRSVVRRLLGR